MHYEYEEVNDLNMLCSLFNKLAVTHGYVSYSLMSIHAVNPSVFALILSSDPTSVLYSNMVFGVFILTFSRPSLRPLPLPTRTIFSVLGTLMFNHFTMEFYEWLAIKYEGRPIFLTILGLVTGNLLWTQMITFFYHLDTRFNPELRRIRAFEGIYMRNVA